MQSHEIIRDYVWDEKQIMNYSCMRSWMIGVSVSHMSTKVAKTMFFLILEMHCVWTPFGDGGPSALWKSQHLQKACVHFGGFLGLKYIHLSMLWKIKGSLVVTCVNIDLPISMGFHTPQLVPISSHQQYQSYPTGAHWNIFWSEIPSRFDLNLQFVTMSMPQITCLVKFVDFWFDSSWDIIMFLHIDV